MTLTKICFWEIDHYIETDFPFGTLTLFEAYNFVVNNTKNIKNYSFTQILSVSSPEKTKNVLFKTPETANKFDKFHLSSLPEFRNQIWTSSHLNSEFYFTFLLLLLEFDFFVTKVGRLPGNIILYK